MNIRNIAGAIAVMLISAAAVTANELSTLQEAYNREMDAIGLAHVMQMTELGQQYAKALDALLAQVKSAGDLDKTTALMDEIKRFADEKKMPDAASKLLDIQNMQAAFTKQASVYDVDKAKKIMDLSAKYDATLDKLQRSLVSSSRIDDARAVQAERDKVAGSEAVVAAKKAVIANAASPANISNSPVPTVSMPKGTKAEIKVHSDDNTHHGLIVKEGEYWTDGDQGRGTIRLTFKDRRFAVAQKPVSAVLKMHGGTSGKATSGASVAVTCGGTKVGTFNGVRQDKWNETILDVKGLTFDGDTLLLNLSQTSTDGSGFMSKATGKGALLQLTY